MEVKLEEKPTKPEKNLNIKKLDTSINKVFKVIRDFKKSKKVKNLLTTRPSYE